MKGNFSYCFFLWMLIATSISCNLTKNNTSPVNLRENYDTPCVFSKNGYSVNTISYGDFKSHNNDQRSSAKDIDKLDINELIRAQYGFFLEIKEKDIFFYNSTKNAIDEGDVIPFDSLEIKFESFVNHQLSENFFFEKHNLIGGPHLALFKANNKNKKGMSQIISESSYADTSQKYIFLIYNYQSYSCFVDLPCNKPVHDSTLVSFTLPFAAILDLNKDSEFYKQSLAYLWCIAQQLVVCSEYRTFCTNYYKNTYKFLKRNIKKKHSVYESYFQLALLQSYEPINLKLKDNSGKKRSFLFTSNNPDYPGNYEVKFNIYEPYRFKVFKR